MKWIRACGLAMAVCSRYSSTLPLPRWNFASISIVTRVPCSIASPRSFSATHSMECFFMSSVPPLPDGISTPSPRPLRISGWLVFVSIRSS